MGINYIYPEFEVIRDENRCIKCRVCERQCANEVHSFDPERGLPPAYDEEPIEGRSIDDGPKKEELQVNPSLAKTGRDPLSEPSSAQADRSNGLPGKERPSVRERTVGYVTSITVSARHSLILIPRARCLFLKILPAYVLRLRE